MGKRVAITQSNYIPWKGYFDLINSVDEFVLYDDMQYTRRDWRNRNKIKTPRGIEWLTIPVQVKGKYFQKIKETQVAEENWAESHWKSIIHNYSRADYFSEFKEVLSEIYKAAARIPLLSHINHLFISEICRILDVRTQISWSSHYELVDGKTERLLRICQQAGATEYISGPSAQSYIDLQAFLNEGIQVTFFDYSGYPEYEQLHPPFEHSVSVIDLILNQGSNAHQFMKSF